MTTRYYVPGLPISSSSGRCVCLLLALRWPGLRSFAAGRLAWLVGWLDGRDYYYYCCPRYVRLVLFLLLCFVLFLLCTGCLVLSFRSIHRRRVCGCKKCLVARCRKLDASVGSQRQSWSLFARCRKLDASVRNSETGLELLCSCSGALALFLGIARSIVRQRDRLMRRDWVFVFRT